MKINLLTDAPRHNLALMKLSAWHKTNGNAVLLNMPIFPAEYSYASILFEKNKKKFIADRYGGPAFDSSILPLGIEVMKPDYELYGHDYSLGYTFRPCFNSCDFCKVPKMNHPSPWHHSIWEFHNPKFKKICLLNNNTFQDALWKETFEEIWDADLTVIDENGYDLRLLNDEKAEALKKIKFQGKLHFAWDRMQDEVLIIEGLKTLRKYKFNGCRVYVLIGYDTTESEDIHRCEIIRQYKQDPYIMPYTQSKPEMRFKRFIDTFMWRKYKTIKKAWNRYEP